MTKEQIIKKLNQSIQNKEPIIGVSIGNGRSAKHVMNGGADMIATLNAGRFRMGGVESTASLLPFNNSNEFVFDFAVREVLPRVKDIPVLFGACAQDPMIDQDAFLDKLVKSGFHGVNNFPTVCLIDGIFREALEAEGEGYIHEVNLIKKANEKGLFTVAFSVTLEEAIMMAKADVDVLCLHFGWTYITRPPDNEIDRYVDNLIRRTNVVFEEIKKIKPNIIPMIYGGAIVRNQKIIKRFYKETDIVGYFGGSVFDTIPVEGNMKSATELFKNINRVSLLEMENANLLKLLQKREGIKSVLGNSIEIRDLISWIKKVSNHNANILIEGESGTGKDLVVKVIHYNSDRAAKQLKKVNCALIPKIMIRSELFGYEKGAFAGADKRHIGRIELANHGTLFLDNVSELNLDVQAKLLRVIQDGEFERVGGSETIKLDVRVVSTTNKDLKKEMMEGRFREDLYYLLTVLNRTLPPLRDHKEDIPIYVNAFLKQIEERHHVNVKVTDFVMNAFMGYDWPGNVRELKNVLERGVILSDKNQIDISCLPGSFGDHRLLDNSVNYIKNSSMLIEKELIVSELIKVNWNQTKVANKLGISRRTLYNKLKK
ncbi:MAG: phosphoenolpyruvate hydrolase family protein, partial [Candidatus Izimaplasma sp.]|nr:phosphoenolpyruvate hydrolase family protein [Candidatus Izimaplasma bacterium]